MNRGSFPGLLAVLLAIPVFLSACGGGGGVNSTTVSGYATRGPVNGATVDVFAINSNGSTGAILGTSTTSNDNTGRFSVTLSSQPTGAIRIDVIGGSYISEYDNNPVNISNSSSMTAILSSVQAGGVSNVSVSPVTDMVAYRAGALIIAGQPPLTALAQANSEAKTAYGLSANPDSIVPSFDYASSSQSNKDSSTLGQNLIALETFVQQAIASDTSASPPTAEAIYNQLGDDFAKDGKIDGVGANQPTLSYGAFVANSLPAALSNAKRISVAAFLNGVTPKSMQTWATTDTTTASAAAGYGITTSTPAGYSCSAGRTLQTDGNELPVCWDGATTSGGANYYGTYYQCPNPADGYQQYAAACPAYCSTGTLKTDQISGQAVCWDGTQRMTDANTPVDVISSTKYTFCPTQGTVLSWGSSCGSGATIGMDILTPTASLPPAPTAINSIVPATYTAPPTPPSTTGVIKPIGSSDLTAIKNSVPNSSPPSYVSPPSQGLNQAQIDAYASFNNWYTFAMY